MPEPTITDIRQAMRVRRFPTITLWNRLEGRPRTHDFNEALKAAVRDPLWMLTKQWQMGEFKGDDAGSPVFAKIHLSTARLDAFQAGDHSTQPFNTDIPLEAQVERRTISFEREGQFIALDLRLLMGRQWLKLMQRIGNFRQEFLDRYPIALPDPSDRSNAAVCADFEAWQHVAAVAGRAMDGYQLYQHLKAGGSAHDGTTISAADHAAVNDLATRFVTWFEALYYQPAPEPDANGSDAWKPEYLEYQFAISAPDETDRPVMQAEEYYHGRLDWYNLDIDPDRATLEPAAPDSAPETIPPPTQSFIPVPLSFEGMPNTRWWTFEDSRTNFGNLSPGTKDLSKLMLMEFGLVYANDWFLFPLTLPIGTTTRIKGLAVTNVFGERTWIEAAGRGADEDWQRWNLYTMAISGTEDLQADMRFVLLPTVPKIQESDPIEDVLLIRDEMANMVWGIETRVPLPHGRSRPGHEAAIDLARFYDRLLNATPAPEPPPAAAPVRYTVMSNKVPENWIPFIPVQVPGDNRQIQLQRSALPRIVARNPASMVEKIRPRTALLGEGRAVNAAYFLHEEEVPRAGIRVMQTFQRTRWHNGSVTTWLGIRKQTGRGEGFSNLRFDYLA
ncbi:hypothetical protein NDI45_24665 [Leptolyngbya sp. GB1-A1]|uniref:hypothetical protein n=1 Tax=Leptolyngbya sp. GB1-A1 TaxID=2933908 RepID=UPI003299EE05